MNQEEIILDWDENRNRMIFLYKRYNQTLEIDETTLVPDADTNLIRILIKKLDQKIQLYKSRLTTQNFINFPINFNYNLRRMNSCKTIKLHLKEKLELLSRV